MPGCAASLVSTCIAELGICHSAHKQNNTRATHKEELPKVLNRFASLQVDFLAGDTLNLPGWVKGKI